MYELGLLVLVHSLLTNLFTHTLKLLGPLTHLFFGELVAILTENLIQPKSLVKKDAHAIEEELWAIRVVVSVKLDYVLVT